ncbi:hypothetical protein FSP39_008848 [Pinctada imbricata]|uniref:Talin-1 n=1 Tax=Pinctada imbricata TaxID=66713 RepID=A0AA89BX52_PINIB|nr:hypothetical protein FSP39_008848 [Pinctada imbricata]
MVTADGRKIVQITMMDMSTKKFEVGENQTVGDLMVNICEHMGIKNHEEYSLVVEVPDEMKGTISRGTLSRMKEKSIAKDEEKMEKLRKKLHTDEELDWLDHSKSLAEQGVTSNMTLILRRKFFYSDRNVDKSDPVQLNLLFSQARDSIINGVHPVTQDEAIQFAGLQCQVQYGDHNEEKHKSLELKEFLPEDYVKKWQIESKIFEEHKKCRGLTELDAKSKYTKKCRRLKTYGITAFLVKEKMPGKNKLVPILFGITKESVVRMDKETKEILKTWPLTKVRKWAASPNSFILDFGDYQEEYYSVQTQEGEEIAKLISGYIDMILKRGRKRHHMMTQPQQALFQDGATIVQKAQTFMDKGYALPQLGNDSASDRWRNDTSDMSKERVTAELSSLSAATAKLVAMAMDPNVETSAVGAAIAQISSNLHDFAGDIAKLAALADDDQSRNNLLGAARQLIGAFSDFLSAARTKEGRENMQEEAEKLKKIIGDVMDSIGKPHGMTDRMYQQRLLALAKDVKIPMTGLVREAKDMVEDDDPDDVKETIDMATTDCDMAVSQLIATTKIVMPMIETPACQDQLKMGMSGVASSVDGLLEALRQSFGDDSLSTGLSSAVAGVTNALKDLLKFMERGPDSDRDTNARERAVDKILTHSDKLFDNAGDGRKMAKHAESMAEVSSVLGKLIQGMGEESDDPDLRKRLLAAAQQVSDATSQLLQAAKGCAGNPDDPSLQDALKYSAENLLAALKGADATAVRNQLIRNLEAAIQRTLYASTQLQTSASTANRSNTNDTSKKELKLHSDTLTDHLPGLVHNLKLSEKNPGDVTSQFSLVHASKEFIPSADSLVSACKTASPTVENIPASINLDHSVREMAAALAQLKTATARAELACTVQDVGGALNMLGTLGRELEEFQGEVSKGNLIPLPRDTAEGCAVKLSGASKVVTSNIGKLMRANSQGESGQFGVISHDTVNALRALIEATRGVAATSPDKNVQNSILDGARNVIDTLRKLLEAANDPNGADQQDLNQMGQAVTSALSKCVNSLPGQVVVDNIISQIIESGKSMATVQLPESDKSLEELQQEMDQAASDFSKAGAEVIGGSRGLPQLAEAARRYVSTYHTLVRTGLATAGKSHPVAEKKIRDNLEKTSTVASQLLMAAKKFAADPNQHNAKNLLQQAARAVTDSINQLIDVCITRTPEQRECDDACRHMQLMKSLLENTSEAMSDMNYSQCIDSISEKTKHLGLAMTGISDTVKKKDSAKFCESVQHVRGAVGGLTEAAAQAAYLVAISDPESVEGRPGLLDPTQFSQANQAVHTVCKKLINLTLSQQQVISEAKVVTKHTTDLCKVCKLAASKTTDPDVKKRFEHSANMMTDLIKSLVRSLKVLESQYTDENRRKCAMAAKPLMQEVDDITVYASSPEFASIPAQISSQAKKAQEPVLKGGRSVVDNACQLLMAAKRMAGNPKDPSTSQKYTEQAKSVNNALKTLLTSARAAAPGQRECEEAISKITKCERDLDHASLEAMTQSLPPRKDNTLNGFQEIMTREIKAIQSMVEEVREAAKSDPVALGNKAMTLSSHFEPLSDSAIGCASLTASVMDEAPLLDLTKTVAESTRELLTTCKNSVGKPEEGSGEAVDNAARSLLEVIRDLLKSLEESASQAGMIERLEDKLNASMAKIHQRQSMGEDMTYSACQTKMIALGKKITRTAQEMNSKAGTSVAELGPYSDQLTDDYDKLASYGASATTVVTSRDLAAKIQTATEEVGKSCVGLVHCAGDVQRDSQDSQLRKALNDSAREVAQKVAAMLAALQEGSKGTEACINAMSNISSVVADLETSIMFAQAGTLTSEGGMFADHREDIATAVKSMVCDTESLAGVVSKQDKLVGAAQQTVVSVTTLADMVKLGAISLGSENSSSQVLLLGAVKDVASALTDLLNTAKTSSEKPDADMTAVEQKKEVAVHKVSALQKAVETIEDESTRGTKALEATIEAIQQEIKSYVDGTLPDKPSSAEDLIRLTKPITLATTKAVTAGNSGRQEDAIICANAGRKAVIDLLGACRGAAVTAETEEVKDLAVRNGQVCAETFRDLLQHVRQMLKSPSKDSKSLLIELSRKVASSVTELVKSAQAIKGSDWEDPDDPTVIAENELLGAAKSIEAAAEKLAQLKPRKKAKEADKSLNFEEHILEATKSIAAATAALVKSASLAQKELVLQGKLAKAYNKSDILEEQGQWSEGLISAARMVARATENLCDAAHDMVQGKASEERLIAAAHEVASSTVALVMACTVKADPNSKSMQRLQEAGNKVKVATDALVKEAREAKTWTEEEEKVVVNKRQVGGIAQEMSAMEEMLKKEKELEQARQRLAKIRKERYQNK